MIEALLSKCYYPLAVNESEHMQVRQESKRTMLE